MEYCYMTTRSYPRGTVSARAPALPFNMSKQALIGLLLVLALFAFEIFNFDTTEFALESLLGAKSFAGLKWATVLAIAFCAIDFAGLARIFTPQTGADEPKEVWYLMGAWLLGATMNAVMTWWAVSLTILDHEFGNEVLSREQILDYVPIFVAVLVWLTRILFISAMAIAGEQFLAGRANTQAVSERAGQPAQPTPAYVRPTMVRHTPATLTLYDRSEADAMTADRPTHPAHTPERTVRPRANYRQVPLTK